MAISTLIGCSWSMQPLNSLTFKAGAHNIRGRGHTISGGGGTQYPGAGAHNIRGRGHTISGGGGTQYPGAGGTQYPGVGAHNIRGWGHTISGGGELPSHPP